MGLKEFLSGLRGGGRQSPRMEVLPDVAAAADPDVQVLDQLHAAGANLDRPTQTLFYVYTPNQEGAKRIAAAVADSTLQAEVKPAALGDGWLCLLQGQMVPSHAVLKSYRSKFEALAAAEGGEYDGWEAAVVK